MIKATLAAAALAAAALTVAAPAHADPTSCNPASHIPPVQRVETPNQRAIIKLRVTHVASLCSPLTGVWVVRDMRIDDYKMLNRDLGCRTFTREADGIGGVFTPWQPTGHATNC